MRNNMGGLDRSLRVIIALLITLLYFNEMIGGTLGIVLLVLAIVFVLTSLVSFCPLYVLFKLNTCKRD
ncbi:hypothetical protein PBAC_28700 [Pedobacter glucosidilyticus]|uniref:DUF2892 domain-containing protein n=1 Tax=Pedobacter aquae TaxID=2605747 RepID=A0A5C0VG67_9SPHI|nr:MULTISPECIES: DUF2892 domain-containing protein [Pedobacter]KHJ36952.1 hypothetical protein PBAC_28700 [Pedobacter glucosidilyticus]QEK50250.1 DUF2892 domain-containing protein [Pedobacter aquae]